MAGTSTTTGSRIRVPVARLAAIGVLAAVALVAAPGVAAAEDRSHPHDVEPIVDCITRHADGSWTVLWGYVNHTGGPVGIPFGPANQVTPPAYGGTRPAAFTTGTQDRDGVVHGAWTATVPRGQALMWHLGPYNVAASGAPDCPPGTQLPADGNGTGTAVALGAAGAVGAAVVCRFRRRLARLEAGTASAGAA